MQGVIVQVNPGTDDDYPATFAFDPTIEWTDEMAAETIAGFLRTMVDEASRCGVNPGMFQMAIVKAMTG